VNNKVKYDLRTSKFVSKIDITISTLEVLISRIDFPGLMNILSRKICFSGTAFPVP